MFRKIAIPVVSVVSIVALLAILGQFNKPAVAQPARDNDEQNRRMSAIENRLRAQIGEVKIWAGKKIPDGWRICNGDALSSKQYPELFQVLEDLYGRGEGASAGGPTCDFNLPDYRGVFLRGLDLGRGFDPDKSREIGSRQEWATARPRTEFATSAAGDHHHGGGYKVICNGHNTPSGQDGTSDEINIKVQNAIPETSAGGHTHTVTGGGDAETRPQNVAVHYIIRVK